LRAPAKKTLPFAVRPDGLSGKGDLNALADAFEQAILNFEKVAVLQTGRSSR
jgi:hypothetical protein